MQKKGPVACNNRRGKTLFLLMATRDEAKAGYRHVLKYTGLFGGVQGLTVLLSLVRNKIASVLLGAEGLGLTALFNSSIKMVCDASSLGLSVSGVKHLAACYDRGDEAEVRQAVAVIRLWSLLAALLGGGLCLACSGWLNRITFAWGNHTLHFMLLSVVVAMSAMTAGEVVILKGTRRLGELARVSVYCVALSILITAPLYYLYGQSGVVPSIILTAFAQMVLTIAFSYRFYKPLPWNSSLTLSQGEGTLSGGENAVSKDFLPLKQVGRCFREGGRMVRLGLVFVIAGVFASITDFLIRRYFSFYADLHVAGLYSSGYTMVMTYGAMVFSSMDSDYFQSSRSAARCMPPSTVRLRWHCCWWARWR